MVHATRLRFEDVDPLGRGTNQLLAVVPNRALTDVAIGRKTCIRPKARSAGCLDGNPECGCKRSEGPIQGTSATWTTRARFGRLQCFCFRERRVKGDGGAGHEQVKRTGILSEKTHGTFGVATATCNGAADRQQ